MQVISGDAILKLSAGHLSIVARKTWTFQINGTRNTVELEHGYWSGSRKITLNGQVIERSNKFWDTGSEHRFEVRGCACILQIRNIPFGFEYEL